MQYSTLRTSHEPVWIVKQVSEAQTQRKPPSDRGLVNQGSGRLNVSTTTTGFCHKRLQFFFYQGILLAYYYDNTKFSEVLWVLWIYSAFFVFSVTEDVWNTVLLLFSVLAPSVSSTWFFVLTFTLLLYGPFATCSCSPLLAIFFSSSAHSPSLWAYIFPSFRLTAHQKLSSQTVCSHVWSLPTIHCFLFMSRILTTSYFKLWYVCLHSFITHFLTCLYSSDHSSFVGWRYDYAFLVVIFLMLMYNTMPCHLCVRSSHRIVAYASIKQLSNPKTQTILYPFIFVLFNTTLLRIPTQPCSNSLFKCSY